VEEDKKAEVVALAKRYSLASHYTSFVAIEERTEATEGTMVSRVIPLNAFGYGESQPSRTRGEGRGGFGRRGRSDYSRASRGPREYDDRGQFDNYNHRGYGGEGGRYGEREGGRRDDARGSAHTRSDESWSDHRGRGRGGRDRDHREQHGRHFQARPRTLEVSADLVERLVAVKAKGGPYWSLTSSISDILGVQLSKLVDGLIGYAVSDYVSTIWATAIVLACVLAHEDAAHTHSELIAEAKGWLSGETEKHGFDGAEKWIKKANDYLIGILN